MTGKQEGTQQFHGIPGFQGEPAFHTEKIQARYGDEGGDPYPHRDPFPDHDAQDGDDDHIQGGEKARLCRGSGGDADLLGGGCDEQEESAQKSAKREYREFKTAVKDPIVQLIDPSAEKKTTRSSGTVTAPMPG
ncbi:MAG: hypothetical protein IIT86_11925, partial [Oscillospiraceae bacterium]|nr:hypothetical protein [Oscillospiraceae bacterium]